MFKDPIIMRVTKGVLLRFWEIHGSNPDTGHLTLSWVIMHTELWLTNLNGRDDKEFLGL
jgi:hypothetical protein